MASVKVNGEPIEGNVIPLFKEGEEVKVSGDGVRDTPSLSNREDGLSFQTRSDIQDCN